MTTHRSEPHHPHGPKPDVIQKEFWQYRRFWIATICVLVAARFLLPHFPLLKGWESKFSVASLEMAKQALPSEALKSMSPEQALRKLYPNILFPENLTKVNGAMFVAAWNCKPLKEDGACLRYLWGNDTLTLVISLKPKKTHKVRGPFGKAGWTGYFAIDKEKSIAASLVGPIDNEDIIGAWPYATTIPKQVLTEPSPTTP